MSPRELLNGLTEPQQEAVTHGDGPLLVLAGPGSGKTRVITHRAAYLAATITRPYHILAITFTNKAAGEMRERIERLTGGGITCSTFHSFCARILRLFGEEVGIHRNFTIFDDSDQQSAMRDAIERSGLSSENFTPGGMLGVISRAKNDMVSAQDFASSGRGGWQDKAIAKVYAAYDAVLAEQNALDFDDLLLRTAWMLRDRADIRGHLEERYHYVLVDEYQDTNHAQYMIARLLAMTRENLCVTGDPDQSIYAWRGANLHNILQFEEDFPNTRVVRLEQNYRSTPQILAAAQEVISNNRKRKKKDLWTDNPAGVNVQVAECEDAGSEATFIASEIRRHVDAGGRYGDVAIFYRVNSLSRAIEGGLRDAHIPYQVARGVAFYHRKEIKDVLAYLRIVANPFDQVALARVVNTPPRGIGKTTLERILACAADTGRSPLEVIASPESIPGASRAIRHLRAFAEFLAGLQQAADRGSVQDTMEYVVRNSGLVAMWSAEQNEDALANVDELITAAAEYDRQRAAGLVVPGLGEAPEAQETPPASDPISDWLTQVSLVSDVDAIDEESGAVTLMTLHAAKGLEFDVVFMAGLEDGLLPHQRSQVERADIEEERRLCFVGMTRARRALTLTYAKWRDFRGVTQRTARSPFLRELPREGVTRISVEDQDEDAREPIVPESGGAWLRWHKGQLVRHPEFGIGRVLWIQPRSQLTHAGVQFAAYGQKTLILEYAKLQAIEPDELD